MIKIFSHIFGKKSKVSTHEYKGVADFFLRASNEEKKRVITEAARRANEDQRKVLVEAHPTMGAR